MEYFWGNTQTDGIDMELFRNLFLSKHLDEYRVFALDYMDKSLFYKKYKNVISCEEADFFENDFSEYDLFVLFGQHKRIIFEIDWSGEEYLGQVKKSINHILKNHGIKDAKWRKDIYGNILKRNNIKRGEYLPLLFNEFNKDLKNINYTMVFFDMGDDAYHYSVMLLDEYGKIKHYDSIGDGKIYELYLIPDNLNSKLLLHLKTTFNLKLNEVKCFVKKDKILMSVGSKMVMKYRKEELEAIGGKIIIEEK